MTDIPERRPDDGVPPIPVPPPVQGSGMPAGGAPAPIPQSEVPTASVPVITAPAPPAPQVPPQPAATAPGTPHPVPPQAFGPGGPPSGPPPRSSLRGLWIALGVVGGILLLGLIAVVILVAVALTTARHWTKVDEPARPATTHSEEYQTGNYDVTDDHVNPCTVGQDWTDCINLLVDEYNAACAGVPLTPDGQTVCTAYLGEIDTMKSEDKPGYYVSTLGDYGHLTRTPEVATRQVSNGDARPARTHRATCYLGFIGECRGMPANGRTPTVGPSPSPSRGTGTDSGTSSGSDS